MENVSAYRIWQAPFAEKKLAPILRHNDLGAVRRVLDVGCGPGTNTRHFATSDYLGVDLNEKYVEYARAKFGRTFVAADVTDLRSRRRRAVRLRPLQQLLPPRRHAGRPADPRPPRDPR